MEIESLGIKGFISELSPYLKSMVQFLLSKVLLSKQASCCRTCLSVTRGGSCTRYWRCLATGCTTSSRITESSCSVTCTVWLLYPRPTRTSCICGNVDPHPHIALHLEHVFSARRSPLQRWEHSSALDHSIGKFWSAAAVHPLPQRPKDGPVSRVWGAEPSLDPHPGPSHARYRYRSLDPLIFTDRTFNIL